MSVRYSEIIFPTSDCFDVDPSPPQVRRVLGQLQSLGWVQDLPENGLYKRLASAYAAIDAWAPPAPLRLWLAGGFDKATANEWPDDQRIFEARFCEDVEIVYGPNLLFFPPGMNGATMPCGSCGDDLVAQPWRRYEQTYSQDTQAALAQYEFHDYIVAPKECLACGAVPRYQELVFRGDRTIACAVFKFVMRCAAARGPSSEDVQLDPAMLAELSTACDFPLRSAGVFE